MFGKSMRIPAAAEALPGRSTPMAVPETHYVNGHRIVAPFPDGLELAMFGLGASGALNESSGSSKACTPRPLAMLPGTRPIRHIAKSAPG